MQFENWKGRVFDQKIISSDPSIQRWQCPIYNGMFDHLWIIYPGFCFCRLIIVICGFAAKVTCTFFAYKRQWRNSPKKNTVRVRKTMLSSTFMIRLQGYSWKSGIAFIAWGGGASKLRELPLKCFLFEPPAAPNPSFGRIF